MLRKFRDTTVREDLKLSSRTYEEQVEYENSMIAEWLEKHPEAIDKSKFVEIAVDGQTGHQRGSNG